MYTYFDNIPNDGFLGWNDVGVGLMIVLTLVGIIIYIFIFCDLDLSKSQNINQLRTSLYSCPIPCNDENDSCIKLNSYRGKNYGFDPNIGEKKHRTYESCSFTGWEASHLILHMFLGFFYNIYISQSISVVFEIWEDYYKDCGSYVDLGVNFTGYCIGYGLKVASGYNNNILPNSLHI
jgi:hypothetical protein